MIELKNVSYSYEKNNVVLSDLSFYVKDGESVGLIGANGAGKSTLMNIMLGILPHEGFISVDGVEINPKNINEIRRKVGLVLQNSDNQMFMPTVYDDIMFAPTNYGMGKDSAERIVDEVLNTLGLMDLKYRYNHKLSVGEKRMAAIATVLAMNPEIILMDEPTSVLDPYNRRKVINIINSMNKTKIIASHDLDLILDTCNRVILISKGMIVADDDVEVILNNRELLEAHKMELPLRFQR